MDQSPQDEASLVSNTEGQQTSSIIATNTAPRTPQNHSKNDMRHGVGLNTRSRPAFAGRERSGTTNNSSNQLQHQPQKHTSIRRAGQLQIHVQQQQQRGTFSMPPNPSPLQKIFAGVRQQQVTNLGMAYLSSGQAEPVQFTANPVAIGQPANAWRQQINTINAAAIPVTIMQHTQSGHRVQASTWYGNIRTSESPGRPEEAIRNMVQMSTLEPSTRTANLNTPHPRETTRNPALLNLLGPRPGDSQGQQVGGLSQPIERYVETAAQIQTNQVATQVALLNGQLGQVPGMRGASQGSGRSVQLIHPNMIYGNQSNSFLSQQSNNSQVHTPPAITVAQETRSVPSRFQRRSLEPAGLNHRKEHRNFSLPLGAAQNVASATSLRLHTKQSMGSSVAPSAKRGQPDASGPSSQAGSSEAFGPQAPNALANMGAYKSEPDEKAGNTKPLGFQSPSGLQRQIANPRPDCYIIVPGEYAPIPALLPYPVSSSPIQVEQSGRTILQSQNSQKFKNRVAIAISGSPASGKSTLVYLLAAVFEGATIRDTGFAGAQTMYPVFNGRVEENPNRKGAITKVFVIHQNSYIKPVAEWPMAEWSELYPYSPAMEVMNPHIGAVRIFANERCNRSYERYWEAAYKANIGVDPGLVSNSSTYHFPQLVAPTPIRISKKGPNLDCRGAVDWVKFGKAINDGMRGHKNEEGMLETEEGQEKIEAYLGETHSNTGIPLVNSRKLEPLRERIREWIRKETAQNDRIGFPGRSVVDGSLREMLILDGSLLYLQSHPNKGAGGEKLMKACDVKLFLSTLETEAIRRCFSQREYLDPPQGTRQPEETWMFEGYISEVAWKEYKSEHAWLFENGDATKRLIKTSPAAYHHGIHVRDFYSANLEEKGHKYEGKKWADETLDWAVRTILFQLSIEEGFGRQAYFTKKMTEATIQKAAEGASGVAQGGAVNDGKQ